MRPFTFEKGRMQGGQFRSSGKGMKMAYLIGFESDKKSCCQFFTVVYSAIICIDPAFRDTNCTVIQNVSSVPLFDGS